MPERKLPLPSRHNPLLEPEHTPQSTSPRASAPARPANPPAAEILVERRRLGETDLQVRPGLVGTSNATKSANLGKFQYCHLRIPLPKDLSGSGVFPIGTAVPVPDSYFLMVSMRIAILKHTEQDLTLTHYSDEARTVMSAGLACTKRPFLGQRRKKRSLRRVTSKRHQAQTPRR